MGNQTSTDSSGVDDSSAIAAPPPNTNGSAKQHAERIASNGNTDPAMNSNGDTAAMSETRQEQQQQQRQEPEQSKTTDDKTATSARSFTGQSQSNTKLYSTDGTVQITDALSDVRVKYHVNSKELGHGHYGVVRKCMDRETKQWYAIKSIRKSKVKKIEVLKREIQILREVKHPNIIELVDVFEDAKYLHLVTELCTGGELFDRIIAKSSSPEGHYSEHDAALVIKSILDAIAYCHSKGIVHRDLKPENFLFLTESEDSPIKIIDFGLSRHKDANDGMMKTKVGTPYYVAPEVLRREYTEACDIWSIGVITYILLCGYPPFYGDNDAEIFNSVRIGQFDFPSPEWDDISKSAKNFVTYLLQQAAELRPTALAAMEHPWITENAPEDRKKILSRQSARGSVFQRYMGMQKLKKAALVTIAQNLTHEQVGSLEDIFQQVDEGGNGRMSLTDFHDSILREKLPTEIQAELVAMKEGLSLSNDETLNWRAFLAATVDKNLVMREDKIRYAFDHFVHGENKDYLTRADFDSIFEGDAQGREVFKFLDTDGDGKVLFEDFRRAMEESILDLGNGEDQ
eukprot:CAMPEP_0116125478 /NCGR_PEP_ID=MMETSP0329-20121206/5831_1 /TAXON_ID=697910 /ORGANISM="Pseudo-nitzschia arenysensis, Strain B593" /LENGTH=570 /DNA_ID=CAMNT_0003619519 /DNA_START=297 /DNA_END=2009 /DNA_ORIENTATION=+